MKERTAVIASVLVAAALLAGCGPSFIISKDGRAYYLGAKSRHLREMLCSSRDMEQVLAEVSLPDAVKKDLFRYTCTEEQSREKVSAIFTFLAPEEKEELKSAFRRRGYDINFVPC